MEKSRGELEKACAEATALSGKNWTHHNFFRISVLADLSLILYIEGTSIYLPWQRKEIIMANKFVHLRQAPDQGILYHYTKSNGLIGIVSNNCFWATKSDFLNDPHEFSHMRTIIEEACRECIPDSALQNQFLRDVLEESVIVTGGRNRDFFVLSFSTCHDSITMWSEFGSKTGYSLAFDSGQIVQRIEEANNVAYHGFVVYDPEALRETMRLLLNDYLPRINRMPLKDILRLGCQEPDNTIYLGACHKFQRIAAVYAMFFKNEAFAPEKEYRFVFRRGKDTVVHFREKDGFLIPYIEVPLSEHLLPLTEVMAAPQNHMDLAKNGVEYLMQYKGYDAKVSVSGIKLRY